MSFACQRDSYQQAFETNVISCELAKIRLQDTQKVSGYNVVFEDTILFPEGGGLLNGALGGGTPGNGIIP